MTILYLPRLITAYDKNRPDHPPIVAWTAYYGWIYINYSPLKNAFVEHYSPAHILHPTHYYTGREWDYVSNTLSPTGYYLRKFIPMSQMRDLSLDSAYEAPNHDPELIIERLL